MKTLASSVLSIIVMSETCTGCCRSSLIGLVMNMMFVSLEQTFRKPTNVVSGKRNEQEVLQIVAKIIISCSIFKSHFGPKPLSLNSPLTFISPLMAL